MLSDAYVDDINDDTKGMTNMSTKQESKQTSFINKMLRLQAKKLIVIALLVTTATQFVNVFYIRKTKTNNIRTTEFLKNVTEHLKSAWYSQKRSTRFNTQIAGGNETTILPTADSNNNINSNNGEVFITVTPTHTLYATQSSNNVIVTITSIRQRDVSGKNSIQENGADAPNASYSFELTMIDKGKTEIREEEHIILKGKNISEIYGTSSSIATDKNRTHYLGKDNNSYCADLSPYLIGALSGWFKVTPKEELETAFPYMEKGGRLRPSHCVPKQRLAIIIPYRNRNQHLHITMQNLIPILRRQQTDVRFFVIEQAANSTFNRGALHNIGFLEAEKLGSFDCFIFHDVDLIPLNDRNLYRCESNPRHYAVALNKYNFKLLHSGYFGGVVGFSREQYLKVNGNSNLYVGWGGEDGDLLKRLLNKNYRVLRYPLEIARYRMIKHSRDKGNEVNPLRYAMLRSATKRQDIEGLNTARYKVLNISLEHLYTWITVAINTTEILMTAPAMTLGDIAESIKSLPSDKVGGTGQEKNNSYSRESTENRPILHHSPDFKSSTFKLDNE